MPLGRSKKTRLFKIAWDYIDDVNLMRENNNTTKEQRTCNVTMTNVRATTVAVENKKLLHVLSVYF